MNQFITHYARWISSHPRWVLMAVVLLTLLILTQMIHFTVNPTPYFLSKQHSSRLADAETKRLFTNTGESAFIAVLTQSDSIFNAQSLKTIQQLTEAMNNLTLLEPDDESQLQTLNIDKKSQQIINTILSSGLSTHDIGLVKQLRRYLAKNDAVSLTWLDDFILRLAPVKKVRSLSTFDDLTVYMEEGEQVLDLAPLMEQVPQTQAGLTDLSNKVMSNPLFVGLLVSKPQNTPLQMNQPFPVKASSIQVELNLSEDDSPKMIALYNQIAAIADEIDTADEILIGGPPMVAAQTAYEMETNNLIMMPFVILVVSLILFFAFRRYQGIVIPLSIAIITTLWTLAIMAITRTPQNIVTTALPVFLISIAVADAIHFLNTYYINRQTQNNQQAIVSSFHHLLRPLLYTSITSAVGFIALSNTDLQFMQEFGIFVSIGIILAFLFTIILLPALLATFDQTANQQTMVNQAKLATLLNAKIQQSIKLILQYKMRFSFLFVTVFILAGVTLPHLVVDNQVVGVFSDDTRIKQDEEKIKAHFGGNTPLSIVLTASEEHYFKQPEVVASIEQFSTELAKINAISYVSALTDFVKRSYQQQENTAYQLPENADASMIAQYLFTYENGSDQEIRDLVDLSYENTRLFITLNSDSSIVINEVMTEINRLAESTLPKGISYKMTGFAELLSKATEEIVINQFENNLIAVLAIFITLLVLYRSFTLAIIGIVPLTLTVYFIFSMMSVLNIPLDIGTALVSCITFGIGIDYAIHFLSTLKSAALNSKESIENIILETVGKVSSPILVNSFSLAAGFLVLMAAGYQPIINLGLIIAAAMMLCALMTLFLLPLLCCRLNPMQLNPQSFLFYSERI